MGYPRERIFRAPARKIIKKLCDDQCIRLPRSVLLRSRHNDLMPFRKACIFTPLHFLKTHTLRLLVTKNIHIGSAPFPRFSVTDKFINFHVFINDNKCSKFWSVTLAHRLMLLGNSDQMCMSSLKDDGSP